MDDELPLVDDPDVDGTDEAAEGEDSADESPKNDVPGEDEEGLEGVAALRTEIAAPAAEPRRGGSMIDRPPQAGSAAVETTPSSRGCVSQARRPAGEGREAPHP